MARLKIPYLVCRRRDDGSVRWYWQPASTLRAQGWRPRRLPDDEAQAIAAARALNRELADWRGGRTAPGGGNATPGAGPGSAPTVQPGTVAWLVRAFKASPGFTRLAETTRRDYAKQLAKVEAWAGAVAAAQLTRRHVLDFYERLSARSRAQANGCLRVLRVLLSYGEQTLDLPRNVARQVRLAGTPPRLGIWPADALEAAIAAADALGRPSIGTAILLAADTAQRQADVLALPLIALTLERDGAGKPTGRGKLRLRQSKRRAMVAVDLTPRLAARLADLVAGRPAGAKAPELLLSETTARGYKPDDFRHQFAAVRDRALVDRAEARRRGGADPAAPDVLAKLTFQDLRDTALTRLAEAGCTVPQIAAVSGHSERSVTAVLKHYLALGEGMASEAIARLVAYEAAHADTDAQA